jgi:hypothetical protein
VPIITTQKQHEGVTIATATGTLTVAPLVDFIQTEWSASDQPILFDSREATASELSASDVRRLADIAGSLYCASRLRAKLAIVVSADETFGLARMFQSLADLGTNVRVFRSMADAESWLET